MVSLRCYFKPWKGIHGCAFVIFLVYNISYGSWFPLCDLYLRPKFSELPSLNTLFNMVFWFRLLPTIFPSCNILIPRYYLTYWSLLLLFALTFWKKNNLQPITVATSQKDFTLLWFLDYFNRVYFSQTYGLKKMYFIW